MKKKGLIISTVAMVVVLIAALTTSTYAWFTTSSITSIEGFGISVKSDNAVNIGIKTDYTSTISSGANGVEEGNFVTGSVTFVTATADSEGPGSKTVPGTWTGNGGLSSTLSHNIDWTSQTKAVGVTSASTAAAATPSNTGLWKDVTGNVIAANGSGDALENQILASANITTKDDNSTSAGDYVHFILGASPTRDLERNNLVVMLYPEAGTSYLGVLASIHVAYRVTLSGATSDPTWTEVDMYDNAATTGSDNHFNKDTKPATVQSKNLISTSVAKAYKDTYAADQIPTGAVALQIEGLDKTKGKISQIELVIYMAGSDDDCDNSGKLSQGKIELFFDTANAITAEKNSDSKLVVNLGESTYTSSNTNIYTATTDVTTGEGSVTVGSSYTTGTVVTGTFSEGVFTSTNKIDSDVKSVIVTDSSNKVIKVIKL